MPELSALLSFEAVVRTGSVASAAVERQVTPSAVSQQIRRLEAELGMRLFVRSATGMRPTRPAEQLLPAVQQAVGAFASVQREAARLATERWTLRVGLTHLADPSRATRAIRRVIDRETHVEIEVRSVPATTAPDDLRRHDLDVVLGAIYGGTGIEVRPAWTEPRVALVPARHRLARSATVTLDDLRAERLAVPGWMDDATLRCWLRAAGLDGMTIGERCCDPVAAMTAVSLGGCVCVVGRPIASHLGDEAVAVVAIADAPPEVVACGYRPRPTFPVRLLLDALCTPHARAGDGLRGVCDGAGS